MTILVVDDTENMRLLICNNLENFGYTDVITAASANEAFLKLTQEPDRSGGTVDLILLDISMPGMDGIEACHRIKTEMGYQDLAVIMVTGDADTYHLTRAFDAGAVDYVTKPFDRLELMARVRSALRLKQATDSQKLANSQLEERNLELQNALENIKTLEGLIQICASCKKIRNDDGDWDVLETYISEHSEAFFSHRICADCEQRVNPNVYGKLTAQEEQARESGKNGATDEQSVPVPNAFQYESHDAIGFAKQE